MAISRLARFAKALLAIDNKKWHIVMREFHAEAYAASLRHFSAI